MLKNEGQNYLLNALRKQRIAVKVYLINGFQAKGSVRSFDKFNVLLKDRNDQTMLYKSAISTIIPSKQIELESGDKKEISSEKEDVMESAKADVGIQELILELLKERKIEVKVYLINGVQVKGIVKFFDTYVVLIQDEKQQNIVYKHAISTIVPSEVIDLKEIMGLKEHGQ